MPESASSTECRRRRTERESVAHELRQRIRDTGFAKSTAYVREVMRHEQSR